MKKHNKHLIILASSSPRRKALLRGLLKNFGLKFVVKPSNIVEYIPKKTVNFGKFAINLALEKAANIAISSSGIIIGADTIVVLNGKILGKPASSSDAIRMLKLLSNKVHTVYTGLAIIDTEKETIYRKYEATKVKFRELSEKEIKFYVRTSPPMDKAGAYGIQDDLGSTFVKKINGDYFNIVGLPILKTYLGLKSMGLII